MLSLDVFRHEVNRNYIFVLKKRKDEREREKLSRFMIEFVAKF
jgi:hypothetical protein